MTDQITDDVQPDETTTVEVEGQGDGGQQGAPYEEYLSRFPEEHRGTAEAAFKEWDAGTTRRFQEAAEYRKTWEPFESLGVNHRSPDEIQWALQLYDVAQNDPQSFQQWFEQQYAQERGLTIQQAQQEIKDQPGQTFDEYFSPDQDQLKSLLEQQLSPMQQQLEQINQWREQQEYQTRLADAERHVHSQLEELKSKHPEDFKIEGPDGKSMAETAIEKFIPGYIDSDPQHAVQRAFADWQSVRAQLEKATLQSKVDQPAPAESGGAVDGRPEMPTTLSEANAMALARLRAVHAA